MRYLLLVCTLLLLISAGCSSRSGGDERSVTEKKRLLADPRVGRYLIEGQRAYERGTYELALAYTDSAEQIAPDLADIDFLRGMVYTQLNQLGIADIAYQVVLEKDSLYPGVRFNMGLNAYRQGKLRDAIDYYQSEREFAEFSGLMLELGRAYAKLGEPDSAQQAYEMAIEMDTSNTTAYMWLGQLYEELGDFDRALEYSYKGLSRQPENLDYQYIIGSLLYRSGKTEEALEYLQPVAEQRPWHHGAQINLGQVLMRLGREEEAQPYFVQADSAQALQQRINEAQQKINVDPEYLDNWIELGSLLRQSGQLDLAIEAFMVATSLEPRNLYIQNNLALLMMENGDTERAVRRFQAILSLDSTLADVWANLGVALANSDRKEAARRALEKALQYSPGHPVIQAYLSELEDQSGER